MRTVIGNGVRAWVLLAAAAGPAAGQDWVEASAGAGPGDAGPGAAAIVRRELLNIPRSGATGPGGIPLTYNHPGCPCETRDGTMVFVWNAGPAEAKPANRVWTTRKPKGGGWSVPVMIEPDVQIDAGTVYQPAVPKDAPLICGYWLGVPRRADCALRLSHDDGKTWSERIRPPKSDDPFYANFPDRRLRLDMHHPLERPDGTLWYATGNHHGPAGKAVVTVVPPDNPSGREPGRTPWRDFFVAPPGSEGRPAVKKLEDPEAKTHPCWLVLSPDQQDLMFVARAGNFHEFSRTTDGGKTWGPWTRFKGGVVGHRGVGAVSLDVAGGPCQGWHVQAGTVKDGLTVAVSRTPADVDSWKAVLRLNPDDKEDSDPNLFQSRHDRRIHLLFTGRHSHVLKYYVLDPDRLVAAGG